jgi:hypothetical protein
MLESVQEFISANSTLVLIAIAAVVAIIAFVIYRRNNGSTGTAPVPTPSHDLEGMESLNTVCDMSSGMCHPQTLTPEQEQQIMMQQQMMMQQMQMQQQEATQEQGQEQEQQQQQQQQQQ